MNIRERANSRIKDKVERLATAIRTFTFRCGNLMCIFVFLSVFLSLQSWSGHMCNRSRNRYSSNIIFSIFRCFLLCADLFIQFTFRARPSRRKIQSHLPTFAFIAWLLFCCLINRCTVLPWIFSVKFSEEAIEFSYLTPSIDISRVIDLGIFAWLHSTVRMVCNNEALARGF